MSVETVYTILLYARLYLSSLESRVGIFYFGFVLVERTVPTLAFLVTVTLKYLNSVVVTTAVCIQAVPCSNLLRATTCPACRHF